MIKFLNIEIEGFGSIAEPLTFELDLGNTLSVIRGDVGAGKTSIPSALCWALFGKSLKDKSTVETWEEIRPDSFRGTKVSVNFIDTNTGNKYTVIRCKSFKGKITIGNNQKVNGGNNLWLLTNGESHLDGKGKVNTQDNIEKAIGYSFELFKNSIVFGQKMKRIIEETGPNKKKVFEEAFDTGFIEEAKGNVNIDKEKIEKAISNKNHDIDNIENQLSSKEELYEQALDNEKNFEKRRKTALKELRAELKEILGEIAQYKKEKNDLKFDSNIDSQVLSKTKELEKAKLNNKKIAELQDEINECEEDILKHNKVINKKPKLCPSCNQPLSNKGYQNMVASAKAAIKILEDDKKEASKELSKLQFIKLEKIEKELENLKGKQVLQNNNKKEIARNKEKLQKLTVKKDKVNKQITKTKNEKIKLKSNKYKKQIKVLTGKYRSIKNDLALLHDSLEIKKWLISDPLSNNGLKAYIFDNLLNKVNDRLDDYSKILGFQVEFGIDLDSHRKDFYQAIMRDDIIIPYEDLSGGQKQLVDTSVAFAIHDVISEIRPTNIMFMDEPFESLGVNEIEIVAELVQEKAKDKSLFLITHHQAFNPMNVNDITVMLDENKRTKIY